MTERTKENKDELSWKKTLDLIKDYFLHSEERYYAWLYLIGAVLAVVALVGLMMAFSWWSAGFWAVLTEKAWIPFLFSMGQFSVILTAFVAVNIVKDYLIGKLSILWRNWLTNKLINELFNSENNYLDLKRFSSQLDNIAQRIQEDVKSFVELTLSLGASVLQASLGLVAFSGSLWIIGGSLSLTLLGLNLVIPGYLFWVALITAAGATAITHWIGKPLAETNKKAEQAEADFRQSLAELNEDAENIAEEHAEDYYKAAIHQRIQAINETAEKKLKIETKLSGFQSFYMEAAQVLPMVLATPPYFAGLIEIGQLMQISMAFTQVNQSLSWFVDSYEGLSSYQTSVKRIVDLQQSLQTDGLAQANAKTILRQEYNQDSIRIEHLNIDHPQASSTASIVRNLNLNLKSGEHILIKGPSGLGKSTVFKAISGTWGYGEGKISLPAGKNLYFLPQKPTIPHDSLMAVLAYPEPASRYTEEQYRAALEKVGGMDAFLDKLNEVRPWSKELSGGQQQRLSFARALLKKPSWLFLDEASSSLDEDSEERVYEAVKELQGTTIVSIAHRRTVEKHHSRIVLFSATPAKEIEIIEQERKELTN